MQHRANAIPESFETIQGYPTTLKLYRIPASRFWYVRSWMDNKMITKSTKTEDKSEAIKAAKTFYNDLLIKRSQNLPLTQSPTFERVALDLLKEDTTRQARGEVGERLVSDEKYIFTADLIPFFRRDHVKDISYQRISDYVEYLRHRGKKPVGSNTVKVHFVYLRKILKHAFRLGMLDKLPIFPTISTVDNPREWLSKPQYELLRKTIAAEILKRVVVRYVPLTDELRLLTTFLVNTFLRPSDVKVLQNKHIEIIKRDNLAYLRIQPPSSKTINTPVVSMEAAVGVYEDLMKLHKADNLAEPDDYVFFPRFKNRAYALQNMRRQFDHVLEKANLKKSPSGTPRTLYSLRHTAIMMRLINGSDVDLLTLARNARTSVDMIERFYARHLDAEMNVEKLHSMKANEGVRRKKPKSAKKLPH